MRFWKVESEEQQHEGDSANWDIDVKTPSPADQHCRLNLKLTSSPAGSIHPPGLGPRRLQHPKQHPCIPDTVLFDAAGQYRLSVSGR